MYIVLTKEYEMDEVHFASAFNNLTDAVKHKHRVKTCYPSDICRVYRLVEVVDPQDLTDEGLS